MSVSSETQGNVPQTRGNPLDDGDDGTKISLSYMYLGHQPTPMPLLHIPHEHMKLYSFKPRKWLLYIATNICGTGGTLRFLTGGEDLYEQEMEEGVNPGDHYVFCYVGVAHFLDGMMRGIRHSQSTISSRSSTVPDTLKNFYGGCPFSHALLGTCDACHLIPHIKGDDYLHRLLAAHSEPDDTIGIDGYQNMIIIYAGLHRTFDGEKYIAFLRTPNEFLKTDEIPGGESAEPDDYRVTLHCFLGDNADRDTYCHGRYSDMTRGAGLRNSPQGEVVEEYRPKGILLDVTYAFNVLHCFGDPAAKKKIEEEDYYPGGIVWQGEDKEGKEDEQERRRRRERGNEERDRRHARRSGTGNNTGRQVEEGEGKVDRWDRILMAPFIFSGIRPEDIEAEGKRQEEEREEYNSQRIAGWREAIGVSEYEECIGDTELEVHDGDDERPVSIEEARSRSLPPYSILPEMTFSSSIASVDSVDVSAPEPLGGNERRIEAAPQSSSAPFDLKADVNAPDIEDTRKRKHQMAEDEDIPTLTHI